MNEIMYHVPSTNMFRILEAMMDFDFGRESKGLKNYIHRPHNLISKKDENGKIVEYRLEIVYTPFKKDECQIKINDNVLTVKCGAENRVRDEDMDYCGISHQSYEFSLPLSDSIEVKDISAKAEDGILYISLPVKKEEEKKLEDNAQYIDIQ